MVSKSKEEIKVILTKPFSLGDTDAAYRAPNLLQRVLSLFKSIRPGSDLTHFQLPPLFNFPKSQLQCYGESVYCTASDLLSKCNREQNPVDRFTSVVAWCISTTRPTMLLAPYNPILGETHHASRGNLNVLLEQVSHHPPVSALHATDEEQNIEMIWCQQPSPKFCGTSVETQVLGKRQLKLLNHGETYEMNCPHLLIRIFPVPDINWVGNVNIRCLETGLAAELSFKSNSYLGLGGNRRLIKGKILNSSSSKVLYEVDGHWDRTVTIKDTSNGKVKVIYDANEVISGLQSPTVRDPKSVMPTESALVWSELSEAILSKEWEKASEAKKVVEERQRKLARERESRGENWIPKHFVVFQSKEGGWECSPIEKWVPSAPIAAL
ncbi:oxysterol-binding protein-related protein 4C-like [Prosopis cineraria]|nr:oxysterol-binding protein-related protein 4C-like [Prosopis cineraria]